MPKTNRIDNMRQRIQVPIILAGLFAFSGCGSMSLFSHRAMAEETPKQPSRSPIAKIMGPTERLLHNQRRDQQAQSAIESDAALAAANKQLQQVRTLYQNGDYATAEKASKALISQRRARYETFGSKVKRFWGVDDSLDIDNYNNFGDAIEEDALFILAESQFEQKRYTKAQDSYDDLLNRYPSTRHMDRVTRQLFRIARYWLGFPNDLNPQQADSEIQLASATDDEVNVSAGEDTSSWDVPLVPNLTDKTRPMYDADGRGLQALRSIWLHDATGPLADDALMLSANHNLRVRNFVEAKRLYDLLREQYPDSPHIKDAFLLGSHVTLASYEGPNYDGRPLAEARDLKQTMLQTFPDLTKDERSMLEGEIDRMHLAEIERLWGQVEFYQRKNVPASIALHCNLIINRYPNSEYAQRARGVLQGLEANAEKSGSPISDWASGRKPSNTPKPEDRKNSDPRLGTKTADRSAGSAAIPQPMPESAENEEDAKPKRSIFGFLRKAEEPPKLEPTPSSTDQAGRVSL